VWAAKQGYSQVLWLNDDVVTEVGSMNFMILWKNKEGVLELITAPLSEGTILPGVTRDSVLTLCREWNEFKVTEAIYTIHDVVNAAKENRIIEVFGSGTAAIVSQVSCIHYNGCDHELPCPSTPEKSLAIRLLNEILSIQYGEKPHKWSVLLD
jgi:branched-chain amino acid aminotransferase